MILDSLPLLLVLAVLRLEVGRLRHFFGDRRERVPPEPGLDVLWALLLAQKCLRGRRPIPLERRRVHHEIRARCGQQKPSDPVGSYARRRLLWLWHGKTTPAETMKTTIESLRGKSPRSSTRKRSVSSHGKNGEQSTLKSSRFFERI